MQNTTGTVENIKEANAVSSPKIDEDDGTLAFLNIPKNPENPIYHCQQVNQSDLVNTSFYVLDCIPNVKTKFGPERMLVILSNHRDAPESEYKKFFTNSKDIKYILNYVKEVLKVKYYVRYADDMVFFASTKEELVFILDKIKQYIGDLSLRLKGNEQIFLVADNRHDNHKRGLDFVGYVFYHNQILIRKTIKKNLARKASKLKKANISDTDYKQAISSWWGWLKTSNSRRLAQKLIKQNILKDLQKKEVVNNYDLFF